MAFLHSAQTVTDASDARIWAAWDYWVMKHWGPFGFIDHVLFPAEKYSTFAWELLSANPTLHFSYILDSRMYSYLRLSGNIWKVGEKWSLLYYLLFLWLLPTISSCLPELSSWSHKNIHKSPCKCITNEVVYTSLCFCREQCLLKRP